MSRTHVSFDGPWSEDHGPDDEPPGEDLAGLVADGLARRSVECSAPSDYEYAWLIECSTGEGRWSLMVGAVGEDPGSGRQWLIFLEPAKTGLLRRSRVGPEVLTPILHEVLVDDLHVVPTWFTDREWNGPEFGDGRPGPLDPD